MSRPLHVGFVLEQALGHVAFGMSLKQFLSQRDDIDATWLEIPFDLGRLGRIPVVGTNWTIRGSVRARIAIEQAQRARPFDVLFLHTQTVSLFAKRIMAKVPTVLSLDATPLNYDELASAYEASTHPEIVERAKLMVHRSIMKRAAGFTVWSEWAKQSLVDHYRVEPSLIQVVYPGTDISRFPSPSERNVARSGPLRVLFVGGDFKRKGGDLLVRVCQALGPEKVRLDLVTSAMIPPGPGLFVHHNVKPFSAELLERYRNADVFALPTRGDCLALVLGEAMASSLPIITTRVGGLAEEVIDGETGYYIEVDDEPALRNRIERLVDDRELVARMGQRSREFGERYFDAKTNANRIGDMLVSIARRG